MLEDVQKDVHCEERKILDNKTIKDCLALLLCANENGDLKLLPLQV